jgi:hypothetical protein
MFEGSLLAYPNISSRYPDMVGIARVGIKKPTQKNPPKKIKLNF